MPLDAHPLGPKLRDRSAVVAIVGLGYAGLPMAIEVARAGFPVLGYDVDRAKVERVNRGQSPVSHILDSEIASLLTAGALRATSDAGALATADVAIICVPTPLTAEGEADMRFVVSAGQAIADHLRPGMLVVLQSTCAPGTTTGLLGPTLEQASGLRAAVDFFLAFAPERIDPGNSRYTVKNTPKLVGGVSPESTRLACELYATFIDRVIPVSSPEVAELAKLTENTFRFINISFANEMALLCDKLSVNVWEVIEAAATKPFAFLAHYPSPGVGGDCIPVVPQYLQAAARQHGLSMGLIRAASDINLAMPRLIVDKLEAALETQGTPMVDARVLAVGVTYKADIADVRGSAAVRVIEEALARGARVAYHDPLIPRLTIGGTATQSAPLTPAELAAADAVLLLTPHSGIDYDLIVREARLVLDTQSGLQPRVAPNVLNVWTPSALPSDLVPLA